MSRRRAFASAARSVPMLVFWMTACASAQRPQDGGTASALAGAVQDARSPANRPPSPLPSAEEEAPDRDPGGEMAQLPPAAPIPEDPGPFPFQEALPAVPPRDAPASRLANLAPADCRKELKRKALPLKPDRRPAKGVATPLRLDGPLGGVTFRAPGARSVYGVLDCRLALALFELSGRLESHHVVEVLIDNVYRPRAHLPGERRKLSQHAYGLAVDIMGFKLDDGRTLLIERDFPAHIGEPVCGPDATAEPAAKDVVTLRSLVCDVARAFLFHHILTPNYDAAHSNHLHLDIKRDERTFMVK